MNQGGYLGLSHICPQFASEGAGICGYELNMVPAMKRNFTLLVRIKSLRGQPDGSYMLTKILDSEWIYHMSAFPCFVVSLTVAQPPAAARAYPLAYAWPTCAWRGPLMCCKP